MVQLKKLNGEHLTCNGVEPCHQQHQDSGEVEVPAQADLHKQSP